MAAPTSFGDKNLLRIRVNAHKNVTEEGAVTHTGMLLGTCRYLLSQWGREALLCEPQVRQRLVDLLP